LQSESGKEVIAESGYVPSENDVSDNIVIYNENEYLVYPNPASEGFYIMGIKQTTQMNLFDYSGRKVFSQVMTDDGYVDISHLRKGFYVVNLSTKDSNKQYKLLKQ
jgi:hypothetical protein